MRIVLLALMLTGCASLGDVYASEIDETIMSDKPIDDVSSCYQVKYSVPTINTAAGEQSIVVKNNQNAPLMVLTLSEINGQTRVDMRRANSMGLVGDWRKCATG